MFILAAIFASSLALTTTTNYRTPENSPEETQCLAEVIYYEAPNETYEGKLAVATVVMNRVKHRDFPKSVCGVVYQRNPKGCQFSWVCGIRPNHGDDVFQRATTLAKDVLERGIRLTTIHNALFFHNTSVVPKWSLSMILIQQIGNHKFYAYKSNKEAKGDT